VIRRLDVNDPGFSGSIEELLHIGSQEELQVSQVVTDIIAAVRQKGDAALIEFTCKFDHREVSEFSQLEISRQDMKQAFFDLDPVVRESLESSVSRVRLYHQNQLKAIGGGVDWNYVDDVGNELGQLVRGMSRVGIYTPGGKAAYPSTILMTAIPARVAGVKEIILMVPTPAGDINQVLLAAAYLCDVDRVITVGGAQAIAALAYGTESIDRVDKIVGPGNIYVATAKGMVFGDVGIDMIAGPSEVVIVADETANIDWMVMDLFAQAEHDEMAQAILISDNQSVLDEVAAAIEQQLEKMQRKDIIRQSLMDRGALIKVNHMGDAADVINRMAPEHLEIVVEDPDSLLKAVKYAGAIFIGNYSAEVIGDYSAGPSHVLPTAGSARFSSPLGVYDFQIRSSLIHCSARGSISLSRDAAILAEEEGLQAHSESAKYRVQG
jgi:histidinol dehydrogenase